MNTSDQTTLTPAQEVAADFSELLNSWSDPSEPSDENDVAVGGLFKKLKAAITKAEEHERETAAALTLMTAERDSLRFAADKLHHAGRLLSFIHNDVITDSRKSVNEAYGNQGLTSMRQLYLDARLAEQANFKSAVASYDLAEDFVSNEARHELEDLKSDAKHWRGLLACDKIRLTEFAADYSHVAFEFYRNCDDDPNSRNTKKSSLPILRNFAHLSYHSRTFDHHIANDGIKGKPDFSTTPDADKEQS
jgi:hypothetical protein